MITTAEMLATAQRALARHLAAPPATETEREQVHADLLRRAEQCAARSRLRYTPRTADEIGRGRSAVTAQHQESLAVATSVQAGLQWAAQADRLRLLAKAWEVPSHQAWESTRAHLASRVDYYQRLLDEESR